MNAWRVLGLEPTRDVAAIRRAYAVAARRYHPEEQPEEFQRVHDAYQQALAYARTAPRQSTISAGGGATPPPAKKYNALGNKAVPKKGVATGGSFAGPVQRPVSGGSRRPRTEARVSPIQRPGAGPEPAWLREATAEGQTELFRQAPVMAAFREVWQDDKKRSDKKLWREYFSSPVFLSAQREDGFPAALLDFVEKEVKNGAQLSQRFLRELAIVYGIRSQSKDYQYLSGAAFPGIDSIREILRLGQPLDRLNHELDKIWAACWRDYFELLAMVKNGSFDNPSRERRWKELFDRYRREKITDRPETTRASEEDVTFRHPYGLRLLAHFVQSNPLPPEALQYLYDTLDLERVAAGSGKRQFGPLLEALTPLLPDQRPIREEKEALRVVRGAVDGYLDRYGRGSLLPNLGVMKSYRREFTQEETDDAQALLRLPQFQRLLLTKRLTESGVIERIVKSYSALLFGLLQEAQKHKGDPVADNLISWCLENVHRREHDPEYFYDVPYSYTDASPKKITLENREYWYYHFCTAFPAALSTEREEFLGKIIIGTYRPSHWWRRAFTGFEEKHQRILSPKSRHFALGEHDVTVTYHFFYQLYQLDGKAWQTIPWEELLALAGEDPLTFWLALPLAQGEESQRRAIRRELAARLPVLPFDEGSSGTILDCLVNQVCTPHRAPEGTVTYREDSQRLYRCMVRPNRTMEVCRAQGILLRREKVWDRPFANEEEAFRTGAAYMEGLLDKPRQRVRSSGGPAFRRYSARDKARALVECLGRGEYTEEDRQRDSGVQLSATRDFLGYGVQHHGSYTADFYRENLHRPFLAAVRAGEQAGERFSVDLRLTVWPIGSKEANEKSTAELFTRLGTLGTACYVMGTIGFEREQFLLVSSSYQRKLFAVKEGDERVIAGRDLAELVEKLLLPSEWEAVAAVEQYQL